MWEDERLHAHRAAGYHVAPEVGGEQFPINRSQPFSIGDIVIAVDAAWRERPPANEPSQPGSTTFTLLLIGIGTLLILAAVAGLGRKETPALPPP